MFLTSTEKLVKRYKVSKQKDKMFEEENRKFCQLKLSAKKQVQINNLALRKLLFLIHKCHYHLKRS